MTVWHWQALRDWDAAQRQIEIRLRARVKRAGLARQVNLELPLHVSDADLDAVSSASIVDRMRSAPGEVTIGLSGGEAIMKWDDLPVFAVIEDMRGGFKAVSGFGMGAIGNVESPFGFSVHPALDDGSIDEAANSPRKALDRKRRQAVDGKPNIIALGLGHSRLHWGWVGPIIVQRIWPNSKYKWITALAAYTPERAWDQPTPTGSISFEWNPNAAISASRELHDVAAGRAEFHLP